MELFSWHALLERGLSGRPIVAIIQLVWQRVVAIRDFTRGLAGRLYRMYIFQADGTAVVEVGIVRGHGITMVWS
jgi:hypothetical protein